MEPLLTIEDVVQSETGAPSGSPFIEFIVRLSAPAASDITFDARTLSGTADASVDLLGIVDDSFTIPAGETTLAISQRISGDSILEPDETVYLRVTNVQGARLEDGAGTVEARAVIVDDDGDARPSLFVDDVTVVEGSGTGTAVFDVTLSRPFSSAVSIPYRTIPVTATSETDFEALSGSLTFAAGQTEASVPVTILGDAAAEASERFQLALDVSALDLANGVDGAVGEALLLDDDSGGGVRPVLSVANVRQIEGGAPSGSPFIAYDLVLSAPTITDVTLDVRTVSGTADASVDLLGILDERVTIPAGDTSLTVFQRIAGDSAAEGDESVGLLLTNLANAAFPGGALEIDARALILDEDGDPRPALFVDDVTLVEGTGQAVFTIALSRPFEAQVRIPFETREITASAGSDFTALSGTVRFAPGQTEAAVAIDVAGDGAIEPTEQFALVLDPSGLDLAGAAGGAASAVGVATLLDDDAGGGTRPVISIADARQIESGSPSGSPFIAYEVRLSAPASTNVSFDARSVSGSADASVDLLGILDERVTIPAGETSATLFQRISGDSAAEGDESVFLELSNPSGAAFEGGATDIRALAAIVDEDGENRPALFVETETVVEGAAGQRIVQVDVVLSRPSAEPITALYSTAPRAGADLADLAGTSGTLVFAPGETRKAVSFTVPGDTAVEPTGLIEVVVVPETSTDFSDGGNGAVGEVLLLDDDAGGGALPVLTVSNVSQIEGGSPSGSPFIPIEVRLSSPAASDVSFDATISSGTADVSVDLLGDASGRYTIPAGETSLIIFQRIRGDSDVEEDETLAIELSNATGAAFAGGGTTLAATAIIRDDDTSVPGLTPLIVENVVVEEPETGSATALFEIRSPVPAGLTISGLYEVFAGTAADGADFAASAGTFTILGGQTSATISVPVFADGLAEGPEAFVLRLTEIENAGTGTSSGEISAIGLIDDGPYAEPDALAATTQATAIFDPLANDREGDGGALAVTGVSQPASGFAGLASDGRLVYRSDPGFTGTDSFLYTVSDAAGFTDSAEVTVSVAAPSIGGSIDVAEAQIVAYLYEAGLDRNGNIDLPGLNFWIDRRESGLPRDALAAAFLDSQEFENAFGDPATLTDEMLVRALYENVLDRAADQSGLDFWLSVLARPAVDRPDLLLAFSTSAENLTGSPQVGDLEEVTPGDWDFA